MREVLSTDPAARPAVALGAAADLGALAALVAALVLVAHGVDDVFRGGRPPGDLVPLLTAAATLGLARGLLQWVGVRAAAGGADRVRRAVRRRLLRATVAAVGAQGGTGTAARASGTADPLDTVDRGGPSPTGTTGGDLGPGVDALDDYVARFVPALLLAAVGPLLVFVVVLTLDPLSSLVLLFAGPMMVVLLALIGRRTRDLTALRLAELTWLHGFFLDLLQGLRPLAANDRADDAADAIEEVGRRHGATTMDVLRTAFQTSLVLEWAATAATALVAVTVSFRMIDGGLSFRVALATLVVVPEFFMPLRRLAVEYHAGQSGEAAWRQLAPRLAPPAEPAPVPMTGRTAGPAAGPTAGPTAGPGTGPPVAPIPVVAPLELVGVTVHHDRTRPALDGVDLRIGPGERVALVGPSGAGKSTVAALVLGLRRPDTGTVRAGGTDLAALDPVAWRRSVAWVPQSPTVFAGTVAHNVRLGRDDAPDEAVTAALAAAGADGFVAALPDGPHTVLSEEGTTLSGGQRQRLAIARAWLRDAPLVVLDEFTAHLDLRTERSVLDAAAHLLDGRTALVIAHRLRTARLADRIVVLDAGRVVGEGTHHELLAGCPTYRDLVAGRRDGRLADGTGAGR